MSFASLRLRVSSRFALITQKAAVTR